MITEITENNLEKRRNNIMADLTHLFKAGQKVRCKNDDFDAAENEFNKGVVKEVYPDHIIVSLTDLDVDMYYKEGFNLDLVYPECNFK